MGPKNRGTRVDETDPPLRVCFLEIYCSEKHADSIILGMNGVAMARNGLILWENDATGSRKVSRYLPDPREAIKRSKKSKNIENRFLQYFPIHIYIYIYNSRSTALAAIMLLIDLL